MATKDMFKNNIYSKSALIWLVKNLSFIVKP